LTSTGTVGPVTAGVVGVTVGEAAAAAAAVAAACAAAEVVLVGVAVLVAALAVGVAVAGAVVAVFVGVDVAAFAVGVAVAVADSLAGVFVGVAAWEPVLWELAAGEADGAGVFDEAGVFAASATGTGTNGAAIGTNGTTSCISREKTIAQASARPRRLLATERCPTTALAAKRRAAMTWPARDCRVC